MVSIAMSKIFNKATPFKRNIVILYLAIMVILNALGKNKWRRDKNSQRAEHHPSDPLSKNYLSSGIIDLISDGLDRFDSF
jgi:hypothetical protein